VLKITHFNDGEFAGKSPIAQFFTSKPCIFSRDCIKTQYIAIFAPVTAGLVKAWPVRVKATTLHITMGERACLCNHATEEEGFALVLLVDGGRTRRGCTELLSRL